MDEKPPTDDWQSYIFSRYNVNKSPFGKQPEKDIDTVVATLKQMADNETAIIEQFVKNEEQNRKIKPKVFRNVCIFAAIQIFIMAIIILIVVIGLVTGDSNFLFIHKIDSSVCEDLFNFLKYYISATIVELLGMLYFIVKRVFSNNVAKMFEVNQKHYNLQNKKQKNNDKQDSG